MMEKEVYAITTTYHRSYNYGATLQAYALQQTLLDLGFKNEILDFPQESDLKKFQLSWNMIKTAKRLMMLFLNAVNRKKRKRLLKAFDEFINENLILTEKCGTVEEIEEKTVDADCYITGSDQVFSLREKAFIVKRNMLEFGDDTVRRYSYAASLAEYDLSTDEQERFCYLLGRFNSVSLREKKAEKYLSQFTDNDYMIHVDPVFLLSEAEWRSILNPCNYNRKYILYFQVNSNPMANDALFTLRTMHGLPVVCVQTNSVVRVKADKVVLDASPKDFLGWIAGADIVVTTSFHGAAFSIIFEKDFYVLTKASSNPIRIQEMLNTFGLENRLVQDLSQISSTERIDYDIVKRKIEDAKRKSLSYLCQIKEECS